MRIFSASFHSTAIRRGGAVWFFQHLAKAHSQEWLCYKGHLK